MEYECAFYDVALDRVVGGGIVVMGTTLCHMHDDGSEHLLVWRALRGAP